jgi:hypothetical protein
MRALLQTTTLSFALWAQVISSNVASPVMRDRTFSPAFSRIGSVSQRSPAILYSPMRLIYMDPYFSAHNPSLPPLTSRGGIIFPLLR